MRNIFPASTRNQITYQYYCTLRHHSWSRWKGYCRLLQNGEYSYHDISVL